LKFPHVVGLRKAAMQKSGPQVARMTKLRWYLWALNMELGSCHPSGV